MKFKDGDRVIYTGPPENYPWSDSKTGIVIGDELGIRLDDFKWYFSDTDYHDTPPWEYYMREQDSDPLHYTQGDVQCIDYIKQVLTQDEYIGYLRGNCIKYQHRMNYKDTPQSNADKLAVYAKWLTEALKEKHK